MHLAQMVEEHRTIRHVEDGKPAGENALTVAAADLVGSWCGHNVLIS